jgi:hypothetical protein
MDVLKGNALSLSRFDDRNADGRSAVWTRFRSRREWPKCLRLDKRDREQHERDHEHET